MALHSATNLARCVSPWQQLNIHPTIGADTRSTSLGHFDRCFAAIFVDADHDAQVDAKAADQEQQGEKRDDRPPAPG